MRERKRRERGRGAHLGVQIGRSPSPKPRAPWGERERWRRGGCCAGKSNERKGEKGGGAHGGRDRATGARGPEWAGLGRAGSRRGAKTLDTHRHRMGTKSRNETKQNTRLNTTSDKKYASVRCNTHDNLGFCSHAIRTPVAILL
jgi:hypothetical protein